MYVNITKRERLAATAEARVRIAQTNYTNEVTAGYQVALLEHIRGVVGEIAVAKALNLYWSGMSGAGVPDVGPFEVRTVKKDNHRLHIKEHDKGSRPFVLVVVSNDLSVARLVGWLYAKEAKQKKYWCEPVAGRGHAFYVPQAKLRGFDYNALQSVYDDFYGDETQKLNRAIFNSLSSPARKKTAK